MASCTALTTFRVATINVHAFHSHSGFTNRNNVNDLVSILNPLNLDLLAVEEVCNDNNWPNFCENLSLKHFIFDSTYGKYHGNGIASHYPIGSSSSQRQCFSCPGGTRSLLQCSLDGDHPFIQNRLFAVTHLDHLDENNRLKQIKEFRPHKKNIDILLGDMNALTREDYSDHYYRHIVLEKREESRWEKPHFDLTKLIRDEWGYQDAFRSFNPQLKDEQVVTCDYGTRIDYIYVHPRVYDKWKLSKCEIIDTKGATDHNIVFAEFELKSK
jgi:endonuclease/exonuclease/phosphatase family metal-dependent hydrolase